MALGFQGVPGVIDTPVAAAFTGELLGFVGFKSDLDAGVIGNALNFGFMLPMVPFLGIGARASIGDRERLGLLKDGSADLHLLVLDEGPFWPALAVGGTDLSGTSYFRTRYAVLSKSFDEYVRVSVGYGDENKQLSGLFAGLELAPIPYLSLLAEYDGKDPGFGLRLFPIPAFVEAYGVPQISGDLVWTRESGLTGQIGLQYRLGEAKFQTQRSERRELRFTSMASTSSAAQALEVLLERMVEQGFEDVRGVLTSSRAVALEYENRRYNRSELDGLGIVLGLATLLLPASVEGIDVVVRQHGLRVFQLGTSRSRFLEFLNEDLDPELYADSLELSAPKSANGRLSEESRRAPTELKLDLTVLPSLQTLVLTEVGVFQYRLTLYPEAVMKLTPGLVFEGRVRIPLTQSHAIFGPLGSTELDRVVLRQALRLPLDTLSLELPVWAQASFGKFGPAVFGASGELAIPLFEGVGLLRAEVAGLSRQLIAPQSIYAIAEARGRFEPWDAHLSVTAGQFVDGDLGWRVELGRFWGSTEITAFAHLGDHGSVGGINLRIPLAPAEELRPFWIRPRFPELAQYGAQTTILETGNWVRTLGGRILPGFHDIPTSYFSRDRLYPAYVRAHVDELRDAARYWLSP